MQNTWFTLKWKQDGGITRRDQYLSRFVCAALHCVSRCLLLLLFQSSQQAAEDNYVLITSGRYCCEERSWKRGTLYSRLSSHLAQAWLAHYHRFDNIMQSVLMEFYSCTLGDFWLWEILPNGLTWQLFYTIYFSVLFTNFINCGVQSL